MKPGRVALAASLFSTLAGCTQGADLEKFCAQLEKVPVVTSTDQLRGPEARTTLTALVRDFGRLQTLAPTEIKADVKTMASSLRTMMDAVNDPNAPKPLEQDAFVQASNRVVSYAGRTCGIRLADR